jgi:hypothetical protein
LPLNEWILMRRTPHVFKPGIPGVIIRTEQFHASSDSGTAF